MDSVELRFVIRFELRVRVRRRRRMRRVRRMSEPRLGLGIGWRPELALLCERRADLGFVEITVENFADGAPLPRSLRRLQERGVVVIPHGISLSLGGAEPVDQARIDRLARMAERCAAPLASEHIAFVRAGGVEIGHLTPIPRTRASVDAVVANVRRVRETLGVPLALENIAALFEWPDAEMDESEFVRDDPGRERRDAAAGRVEPSCQRPQPRRRHGRH